MPAMEFQAYPSAVRGKKDQNVFLKIQSVLHSTDSIALPCSLLLVGSLLVMYQHLTDDDTGRHSVRNFLAKLLVSMVPLAILERKILQCSDPVGLFAKFSAKVMLMHACFLGLRLACLLFPDVKVGHTYANILAFVGSCIMLPWIFGLRSAASFFREHADVWCLALCTCLIALVEVCALGRFGFRSPATRNIFIEDCILTGSDYIEIISFVPAVWMACRKDADVPNSKLEDTQRRAVCLFAFLMAFYSVEDVANAFALRQDFPRAAVGHIAHFLLLVDFCAFLLAHLYDPEKLAQLKGTIYSWVVDACAV